MAVHRNVYSLTSFLSLHFKGASPNENHRILFKMIAFHMLELDFGCSHCCSVFQWIFSLANFQLNELFPLVSWCPLNWEFTDCASSFCALSFFKTPCTLCCKGTVLLVCLLSFKDAVVVKRSLDAPHVADILRHYSSLYFFLCTACWITVGHRSYRQCQHRLEPLFQARDNVYQNKVRQKLVVDIAFYKINI